MIFLDYFNIVYVYYKLGRRGSAPVDLLTHSIDLYKWNELTDRNRLFRRNSDAAYNNEKNRKYQMIKIVMKISWRGDYYCMYLAKKQQIYVTN